MPEPTVCVGLVTRPHGVRGELSLQNRSDNPNRWEPGSIVYTPDGRSLTVREARQHGARLLVTFEGIHDRSAAEALCGTELFVPASWLPALGPDEWWPHEIEGCRVTTESGRDLGLVTSVLTLPDPADDLWVAVDEHGVETLVPVVREILVEVDVPAKTILLRDVPGLTAPDTAEEDR